MLNIESTIKLNNGQQMPLLGLGTWQSKDGEVAYHAVQSALHAGYRHIDTAKFYFNEVSVGKAIRESGISREDIWLTTKLFPTDAWNAQKAFDTSFGKLGLDYIDLYLIHWPMPGLTKRNWLKMEKIFAGGRVKAIGVSNYSIKHLEDTLSVAKVKPTVNQIKLSPYNYDSKMHRYCQENDIALEAYSPLTRGKNLEDDRLIETAKKYNKSTAQILLRWALQKDIIVIPKSTHEERIKENANLYDFEITQKDMSQLDSFSDK
ncbi:MAG: aldo/keto reductase [bacterium]